MPRLSPTIEGFRATFRRPSLTMAEIAWRWSVGAAGCILFVLSLLEYLNTLPVNKGELLFLRSRQPVLISRALAHILRGSLTRISFAGLFVAAALTVLWIVAASLGRGTTVSALRTYLRDRIALSVSAATGAPPGAKFEGESRPTSPIAAKSDGGEPDKTDKLITESNAGRESLPGLLPLIGLNFLRAGLTLAAIFGLIGASILASFASTDKNPQPGFAFFLFLPLAALVGVFWSKLNWFLSLAAVFLVRSRNGRDDSKGDNKKAESKNDALDAISAAVALCRERFGPIAAVSAWFALAHIAAFIGAITAEFFFLSFLQILPGRVVLSAMVCIALIYFALVDWLYMGRLAGYVCIIEMPDELSAPPPLPMSPPTRPQPIRTTPIATSIDRNEPIISDISGLPVET